MKRQRWIGEGRTFRSESNRKISLIRAGVGPHFAQIKKKWNTQGKFINELKKGNEGGAQC